uniref:Caspase domain-containing protein n=1 Tax=Candidatus Kentrum sp. MB TaxID=2138164 RepID=A0A451BFK2_9GAMM|nr:MAG: Caspase domain-containing protein [Candidatus Kentron sp. MB]VFK34953.1 MAG: Caspase domain-containing protein [Candidatus Kentron sp. MB]VFK77063.1 MAG: Caspase domain-containing protein [Candidatus Kentron sp. MB]
MNKIALLIGVGQYPATDLSPLPTAVNDIHALGKVLRHPEMGGFPESQVTLLENPGRVTMEAAIEKLFSKREQDDLALLYFSGHGIKDETGALHLATFETYKTSDGQLVRASAIPATIVNDHIHGAQPRPASGSDPG